MLHGIDTIREGSKRPLQDVDTDIICVLGTAFMDNANQPLPIRNYQDIARYAGKNLSDFTLCDALETILNESGGATIYMINVFDKTKHVTSETDKVFTPVAGKFTIDEVGVSEFSIADATVDVDYRLIDMIHSTVVELISDELLEMETISCSYSFADVSKVTDADVVGTVDENGNRTGSKAICTITQLYGDDVNIII
ncbi:hypothetical protein IJV79_01270, partial [bacterium]|nr:hypothetical protein [bacterium]